jgi:uncharacterized damage-inducible protein DinB
VFASSIRTLYDYNRWANQRILVAASQVSPDRLSRGDGGYGSLFETLVHLASVEWVFLERMIGRSPRAQWSTAEFADLDALRSRWEEVEADLHWFVAELTDDDLARDRSYTNFQGEVWSYPMWQQVLHVVNHGTQHRSEVAVELTRLGHSPGWLDYLFYIDEVSSTANE